MSKATMPESTESELRFGIGRSFSEMASETSVVTSESSVSKSSMTESTVSEAMTELRFGIGRSLSYKTSKTENVLSFIPLTAKKETNPEINIFS
jgi:hypothetical protein